MDMGGDQHVAGGGFHDQAETTTPLSNTTSEGCPLLQAYVDVFYIYVLGMGPVIITGFITNAINILILRRHFNTINSFFLLQFLAVTDLFFLLICFIYFPVRHLHVLATRGDEIMRRDDWSHAVYILQVVDPLFYLGQASRNWTVLLVTFERFVNMVYPNFAQRNITRFRLCIAWVAIVITASIYPIEKFRVMSFKQVINPCSGDIDYVISYRPGYEYSGHVWRIYYIAGIVIIPVILLWVMNITLIVNLKRRLNRKAEAEGIKAKKDQDLERQATRMVIGVLTVFTLLETPGCVDRLVAICGVKYSEATFHFYQYWRKTALFLNVTHSAVNFLAYCASNPVFRGILVDFVCRRQPQPVQRDEGHKNLSESGRSEPDEIDVQEIGTI